MSKKKRKSINKTKWRAEGGAAGNGLIQVSTVIPWLIPEEVNEQNFKEITDLQIKAMLPQTKSVSANASDKAYIEIYNLSDDTVEHINNSIYPI